MPSIKENILENVKFDNIYPEIKYIYKNIRKLELNEEPDYELYLILFYNLLKRLNFDSEKSKNEYWQKILAQILNIEDLEFKYENSCEVIKQVLSELPIEFSFHNKRK